MQKVKGPELVISNALRTAVGVVIFCFFLAGLVASMNDTLNPFLKRTYGLGYAEAALIQFSYYGANLFFAIPIGWALGLYGYGRVLRGGMFILGVSCLIMVGGAMLNFFPLYLLAVAVMAMGASTMTISGNPYMSVLGSEKYAAARINLVNSFYTVGATLGPFLGARYIMGSSLPGAVPIQPFYLTLGLAVVVMAGIVAFIPLAEPTIQAEAGERFVPWKNNRFLFGWVAWFLYVGAEVVIPTNIVNLLASPEMGGLAPEASGKWISMYWASMMVGRVVGIPLLNKYRPGQLLPLFVIAAIIVAAVLIFGPGAWGRWAILGMGLSHSLMFSCIFLIATKGLGKQTGPATGWLFMAGTGGGLVTLLQGYLADVFHLRASLGILFLSYVYIFLFSRIFGNSKKQNPELHEI